MSRLTRNFSSRFAINPSMRKSRTRFKRPFDHKTTFNAGQLIPIFYEEVLPGDTVKLDMASLVRMSTPKFPVMDDAWIETFFFFVPNRLVWEHWEEFMGANKTDAWTQEVKYQIPVVSARAPGTGASYQFKLGSIADYFGVPTYIGGGSSSFQVSQLPFRAYALIWNEWFRDENLQSPVLVDLSDSTKYIPGYSTLQPFAPDNASYGYSAPALVGKFHDYFTSALPQPQKGDAVLLPLGDSAPVNFSQTSLLVDSVASNHSVSSPVGLHGIFYGSPSPASVRPLLVSGSSSNLSVYGGSVSSVNTSDPFVPDNLEASLSNLSAVADLSEATAATINSIRQAFQTQKLLETDARAGTRYTEILSGHFGVDAGDARLQRPEYLGGTRERIGMQQVLQTSSTDSVSPQGHTAAFSLTTSRGKVFTKSFVEHGMLIGLACVRNRQSYQQGLHKKWTRRDRLDFYFPVFAHLGEQPIFNKEIYAQGTSTDDEVFGYQEAWAEYRYSPSYVTGYMRSNAPGGSLDVWHYADDYDSLPILGSTWIQASPVNIDRTIAVTSDLTHQFIADFYFDPVWIREIPMYSVPGLVDHF